MRRRQLRDKDFLQELEAFASSQRELIQAECDGFATDPAARDERSTRARADFRYFARTYFPHYIRQAEESHFQRWFYDNVPGLIDSPRGNLVNISAPRGEAKSTLATQIFVLWCVITERKWFVPIVMDAFEQAAPMLEAIKVELTDNPRLAMDFPREAGRGRVWQVGVILTNNNRKVQAFGSGKRMRGLRHGPHRPDLVLLDDIENDVNVLSKPYRDKIESWVLKTVLPLGPPEGTMDVLYPNTILHHDSVANRFHRKPRWVRRKFKAVIEWPHRMDLWDRWEELLQQEAAPPEELPEGASVGEAEAFYRENKAEMDRGAVVSWPSVRPIYELMLIRAEDHHAFDCEYQNDPTNVEKAFFTNMQFWVHRDAQWIFHGVLDPSLGKSSRKGDPAAMLVGGFRRDLGKLSIVEAAVARMKPEKQLEKLMLWQQEYRCVVWGIEDTAFQEYFRQQIVAQSAAAGVPIPAIGIRNERDKDILIEAVAPHANNGLILFHQSHYAFNTQVRHWPEADHDDGPDALQMLWKLCVSRRGGVPRMRLGKPRK